MCPAGRPQTTQSNRTPRETERQDLQFDTIIFKIKRFFSSSKPAFLLIQILLRSLSFFLLVSELSSELLQLTRYSGGVLIFDRSSYPIHGAEIIHYATLARLVI